GFFNLVKEFFTGKKDEPIEKAGRKISSANMKRIDEAIQALQSIKNETEGDEEEVKKEDIEKAVQDALKPINERLDKLEKSEEETTDQPKDDDIATVVSEAIQKALEPINERLEAIEKARAISK